MTKNTSTKKTATNFRLDKDTIKKLDWLKARYHVSTRTAALVIALGNEAFRLGAPDEIRYPDWALKARNHADISVTMTPAETGE